MTLFWYGVLLAIGLFAALMGAMEVGRKSLERAKKDEDPSVGPIEAAVFATLGLLLAFAYSAAFERFEDRRVIDVKEANALETVLLRSDILAPDDRAKSRELLRRYVDNRLAYGRALTEGTPRKPLEEDLLVIQAGLWRLAHSEGEQTVTPVLVSYVPALNQLFDASAERETATRAHMPTAMLLLLAGLSILSAYLAGRGTANSAGRTLVHRVIFALMIVLTLAVIMDFDYPRVGFIRIDFVDHELYKVQRQLTP